MYLQDLLKILDIGTNYCSLDMIKKIQDCQTFHYVLRIHHFDEHKFEKWCNKNKIQQGVVEKDNNLVYRLDRYTN